MEPLERPARREKPPRRVVVADVHVVHGCRRVRLVMLVRCPHCSNVHQHSARAGFTEGKRTAGCHLGAYVVRAADVAAAVA